MRPFASRGRGASRRVEARLAGPERELLTALFSDVAELLDDGSAASSDPLADLVGWEPADGDPAEAGHAGGDPAAAGPTDPALARLLPSANREDPAAAAEFRRLTERGLRRRKRDALGQAIAVLNTAGDHLVLEPADAEAVLKSLTDVRLVLAERIGIRTDEDAAALHEVGLLGESGEPVDHAQAMAALYELLTWWQENLVEALAAAHHR